MRLRCEYSTNKIPVANKMMFVSLIKEALKRANEEYYSKLYEYEGKSNKQIKNFCFSVMLKDFKLDLENQVFVINDRIVFNITTPDYEFAINIYNGLLNTSFFKYKEFTMEKLRISLVKEKFINQDQVLMKTMSPLCVRSKDNRFMEPKDIGYMEELNYIVDLNLKSFRNYGLKQALKFEDVSMKKVVVKEEIRGHKEASGRENFYVNAYHGVFKLSGDIEDLNFIYQSGLGFRRSQGFGMVDIV